MRTCKVFLILLSFFGFAFLFHPKIASAKNVTINITEDGFSPTTLEIEKGEKVTFINKGKLSHWPASDIHPTHAIYPEFDPKSPMPRGSSWSFTFDKVGIWQFHDHLNPRATGKITVVGYFKPDSKAFKIPNLKQIPGNISIYFTQKYYQLFPSKLANILANTNMYEEAKKEDRISYWLKLVGTKKVMQELVDDTNGGSTYDCHQEAHKTGRIAYEIFGAEVFAKGDSSCHSGFYHGAMEAFLRDKGTVNLGENIRKVCTSFPTTFGTFECLHGVGHGIMAYLNYDLPEGLRTCDELSTEYDRSSCYGGIFMENIVTALGLGAKPGHETAWLNNDPLFPCNAVDTKSSVQIQCYLIQTARMMQLFNNDFSKIAKACETAPDDMKHTCFQSLGRDLAGAVLRSPDGILATCNKVDEEYYEDCLRGSAYVIVEFWGERLKDQAYQLCKRTGTEVQKEFCYSIVFGRLGDIYGNDRAKIRQSCSFAEEPYRLRCLNEFI